MIEQNKQLYQLEKQVEQLLKERASQTISDTPIETQQLETEKLTKVM